VNFGGPPLCYAPSNPLIFFLLSIVLRFGRPHHHNHSIWPLLTWFGSKTVKHSEHWFALQKHKRRWQKLSEYTLVMVSTNKGQFPRQFVCLMSVLYKWIDLLRGMIIHFSITRLTPVGLSVILDKTKNGVVLTEFTAENKLLMEYIACICVYFICNICIGSWFTQFMHDT
jgi:hypothetical protein